MSVCLHLRDENFMATVTDELIHRIWHIFILKLHSDSYWYLLNFGDNLSKDSFIVYHFFQNFWGSQISSSVV